MANQSCIIGQAKIEKISFSKSRKKLMIYARALEVLSYPQYHHTVHQILETAGAGKNAEVVFAIPFETLEQVKVFSIGYARQRIPGIVPVLFSSVWAKNENYIDVIPKDDLEYQILMKFEDKETLVELLQQSGMHLNFCRANYQPSQDADILQPGEGDLVEDGIPASSVEEKTPFLLPEEQEGHAQERRKKASQKKSPVKKKAQDEQKGKVLYGREYKSRKIDDIASITTDQGQASVVGAPINIECKKTKRENRDILIFGVTDYYGTITVKAYMDSKMAQRAAATMGKGGKVAVRGLVDFDRMTREATIMADDIVWYNDPGRQDLAEEKRVELHAHTKMSGQDGVCNAADLVLAASKMGHKAVAITDHGVVQAFPEAFGATKKAPNEIKIIYGVEAYMANDTSYEGEDGPLEDFVVFDIETTGLDAVEDEIIEIAGTRVLNGKILEEFSTFVKPTSPIPARITELTGIHNDMVADAPDCHTALEAFARFVGQSVLVAHNARFDVSFIRNHGEKYGLNFHNGVIDSLALARMVLPELSRHSLAALTKHFDVPLEGHHRAINDVRMTVQVVNKLLELVNATGVRFLHELNGLGEVKMLPNYHTILLAKNKEGLKNLYKIVTESHLHHFHRRPVIPKSFVETHREGLYIGSACEAGELFRALIGRQDEYHLEQIAKFYDYLEVQPLGNNAFLLRDERDAAWIREEEDLRELNRQIVRLGDWLDIPVVATCDSHFVEPHEEYFRRILMSVQGFADAENQAPLYYRTTEEMLEEFSYLGEEKAREIVVENPSKIADTVEGGYGPYPDDKTYVPKEEGGEELMRQIAFDGAKALYGDPLPSMIEQRLEKEVGSITKHGFAVLYLSAYRLVKKSMDDGYTVGSRGSVGSSFTALAMGISEVNPLAAHYRCPVCKRSEFDTGHPEIDCGIDLPDRMCPNCGVPYVKDGFDIPFEVFLGFNGDKVPDIDLNFSGEYQGQAFKKVEEMFGKENVYRAGTVIGIQENTAYGYIKAYLEEKGKSASRAEIQRLKDGIVGIKRTTGRHPGGLVIIPQDVDVYDFTPLQKPADNVDTDIITTHFDFNSLHDRLIKLDILGHDNPTMMRRLFDFTGIDPLTVPLNDPKTLSLFTSIDALGMKENDLGLKSGVLGLPEFGTSFVRGMLEETRPTTVGELIRISGLSHGTDVWLNNAQDLIRDNIATLSQCICTRDDIMNSLITMGVEKKMAFTIMEKVRKGKGLTPEMEEAMIAANVPSWFIDSCKKIKYMFPKAHAAAYVVSALRIGYYKANHPLAFYAAHFSVRGEEFDAEKVINGYDHAKSELMALKNKPGATTRDEKEIAHLELACEMMLRGYEFLKPDLFLSEASLFQIENGALRLPLTSIPGMGEGAAQSVVEIRKEGNIHTIEDIRKYTKVNNTLIDKLKGMGALSDMPESAQVTLFD